mmetsp:Transcript_35744/g.40586  ORF Transcript_35744/g.40586 Transcript_35744/m.40586 type:complete len:94 (-) Transcript_35744:55-336(-)
MDVEWYEQHKKQEQKNDRNQYIYELVRMRELFASSCRVIALTLLYDYDTPHCDMDQSFKQINLFLPPFVRPSYNNHDQTYAWDTVPMDSVQRP